MIKLTLYNKNMINQSVTQKIPPVFQLIREAVQQYKGSARTLLILSLLPVGASFFMGLLTVVMIALALSGLNIYSSPIGWILQAGSVIVGVIILIALVLLQLWGPLAMTVVLRDQAQNYTPKQALLRSMGLIKPYIQTALSVLLSVWGVAMIVAVPIFIILVAMSASQLSLPIDSSILSPVILLFAGLPLLVVSVWLSFSLIIVVFEDQMSAMARLAVSRNLIRGYWWSVLWRLVAVIVITLLPYLVVTILSLFLGWTSLDWLMYVFNWVLVPFNLAFTIGLYRHLRQLQPVLEPSILNYTKKLFTAFIIFGLLALTMFIVLTFIF